MVAEYPATNTISKNRNDYYCDLDYELKATANLGEFRLPFLGWSQDLSSYSDGLDVTLLELETTRILCEEGATWQPTHAPVRSSASSAGGGAGVAIAIIFIVLCVCGAGGVYVCMQQRRKRGAKPEVNIPTALVLNQQPAVCVDVEASPGDVAPNVAPQSDPNTGEPLKTKFDPNTGEPLATPTPEVEPAASFDPYTGEPLKQKFDPNTGEPLKPKQKFDPNTGEPLKPKFDPYTGAPLEPVPEQPPVQAEDGADEAQAADESVCGINLCGAA